MAFRDAETLDFTAQDIFVLTGPTGSGKSSILDAMSFALYGETPRMGSRDLKKLIYQDVENPAQKAQVVLAFRHQGQDYRITRQITHQAHRVELDSRANPESEWEPYLTGSVSEIKKFIPELLGLSFKAFCRVLVLPQGGFDQFLKQDNASERRALLMNLAQLGVYERIQQAADERRKAGGTRLSYIKGELQGIGAISANALLAQEEELSAVEAQNALDRETLTALEAELKAAEQLWEALQEEAELLTAREAHRQASTAMKAREQQVQVGEQLLALRPQLNYLEKSLQKRQQLEVIHQALARDAELLATQGQALALTRAELAEAAQALPQWQAALARHQGLLPTVERYENLRRQHTELTERLQQYQQQHAQAQQKAAQATAAQAEIAENQQQLQQRIAAIQVSEEDLEALAELGHQLKTLHEHLQPALTVAQQDFKAWKHDLQHHAQAAEQAEQAYQQAQQNTLQARKALEQAQQALETARQEAVALSVRQHLNEGGDCPVCTQSVSAQLYGYLKHHDTEALTHQQRTQALQANLQACTQALSRCEAQEQQAFRDVSQRQSQWQNHQAQEQSLRERRQKAYAAARDLTLTLREQLQVEQLPALEQVRADYRTQRQVLRQRKALEETLQTQERKFQAQGLELARAEAALQEKEAAMTQLQEQLTVQKQRYQQTLSTLQEVLGAEPTTAEPMTAELAEESASDAESGTEIDYGQRCQTRIAQYTCSIEAHQSRERDFLQQEQAWQKQESMAEVRRQENARQLEQLDADIAQARAELREAQERLGYADLKALRADVPDVETLQTWKTELETHRSQAIFLAQGLERVQQQIAGQTLTLEILEGQRQRYVQLKNEVDQRRTEAAVLRERLKLAREQQARSVSLQEELDLLSAQQALYERIYHDLSSRHLPDFLAKRILERVMAEGSQELEQLSNGRYCFELDENEELVVLDAWNAQEPRSVKTLSGGESFLASLALALALNHYLSQGIQLDSLFIDEGFGTLDAESLEMAASVVEKLQLSGKCVGIITHIPELAERFEARIEVIKSETGARLQQAYA